MKFAGAVGFWEKDVEKKPGIFGDRIVERKYTGDITRSFRKWGPQDSSTQDTLRLNNQVSIIADLYAQQNWSSIKYVLWMGVRWEVNTIEVKPPRVILEIGGVWNGSTPETPGASEPSGELHKTVSWDELKNEACLL